MENFSRLTEQTRTLLSRFPVRKSRAQKENFRGWLAEELRTAGYAVTEETGGKFIRGTNVLAGDPETAKVVFTAHYDTPARLPFPNLIAPKSLPLLVLMFAVTIGLELAVLFAADSSLLGMLACDAALITFLALVYVGPANPHNVNDNTSGAAVLLETALALPPELRERTAFVFFDNEEKGMAGSGAFRKRHGKVMKETLVVNFDCVSDGDGLYFFPTKALKRREDLLEALETSFAAEGGKSVDVVRGFGFYPSDQVGFPLAVGAAALRRGRFGCWLGRIHTARDTVFQAENIAQLRQGALALAADLNGRNG